VDTRPVNILSLCSGGAGLDLGVELACPGARVVCYVEREAFACAYLVEAMQAGCLDEAPIWTDLRTFDCGPWRGKVDIVTAGYPCQPFSVAGKRRGKDDPRHLWPEVLRIIRDVGPRYALLENVAGHVILGLDEVIGDLSKIGYGAVWRTVRADAVGATHRRERLFILAYREDTNGRAGIAAVEGKARCRRREPAMDGAELADADHNAAGDDAGQSGRRDARQPVEKLADCPRTGLEGWPDDTDAARREEPAGPVGHRGAAVPLFPPGPADLTAWRRILAERPDLAPAVEPGVRDVADGLAAARIDRLRLLGNGVVPLQAAYALRTLATAAGLTLQPPTEGDVTDG
jgi:DNA (cytosine-5)-methyltransferase 1